MTVEEFKVWLKKFDADGDGRISKNELRTAMRDLGMCFTTWKSRKGVRIADANGDGFIDDNEIEGLASMPFCPPRHSFQDEMTEEEFKKWLKQFDVDGDGRISKKELQKALRSLGMHFTAWKSGRGIRVADTNRNGFIDENEIKDLVEFAKNKLGIMIHTK
ncbi:Calmodulin [Thalictrum thalictroides]|uniref:Calmodulin n=1 Tax=Thalictrum thalictroides TaxID=46969 RepID=A0A7J6W9H5_THATH|nr:Calmodulin [Thalictrum thalictroides]